MFLCFYKTANPGCYLPLSRGDVHVYKNMFIHHLLQKLLANQTKFYVGHQWEGVNRNLYKWSMSHDQVIFCFKIRCPMILKLEVEHAFIWGKQLANGQNDKIIPSL